MGGTVSRAGKRVNRRFNIENRAQKAVEKMKTDPASRMAPKHESTKKLLDDFQKEHPELLEVQTTKIESLHERLKGMEVTPDKVAEIVESSRKLPTNRESRFGNEPARIPMGKCSIQQAVMFMGKHQTDREKVTAQTIASEYTLDPERVKHILKYFKLLQLYTPQELDQSKVKEHFPTHDQPFLTPGKKQPKDFTPE